VSQAPDGAEWLHEIKFDGYRMHARVESGRGRLLTRTDLDWTSNYLAIADAATALPLGSAYTDGESCGVRADGITSFSLSRMRAIPATVKRSSFSSSICSTLTEKTRRPSPWSSARRVDFARSAVRQ
jgi:ATP-dependent DNA ligase